MIFDKRVHFKGNEYPELIAFKDAIRHSYWIHTEFSFVSDTQDYHTRLTRSEREVVRKTMLAISQIEVSVKTFWGNLYNRMPKPEIGAVGFTFSESEVRHGDAYSFLLELLGLNNEFEKIYEIPAIIGRVEYLSKYSSSSRSNKEYIKSLILFSIFIEHISLFSQFLILMSFNKHKNMFKGISNVIEATSKEEDIHGRFGIAVIDIVRNEFPEWFDDQMYSDIENACIKSFKAEQKILSWIFEEGELDFLSQKEIEEFVKNRFNNSLKAVKAKPIFEIDEQLLEKTDWFDDEVLTGKHTDFFYKRPTDYSKKNVSITEDDLF